jgi:hypothetical protein
MTQAKPLPDLDRVRQAYIRGHLAQTLSKCTTTQKIRVLLDVSSILLLIVEENFGSVDDILDRLKREIAAQVDDDGRVGQGPPKPPTTVFRPAQRTREQNVKHLVLLIKS